LLDRNQFEEWINASHKLYEIFEQRYDAYPLAVRWVQQWQSFGRFIIEPREMTVINDLVHNFDCNAFRNLNSTFERNPLKWRPFSAKITERFKMFVANNLKSGESEDVGKGVALYLLTWNFQRFKEYFKYNEQFDIALYFTELGAFLKMKTTELKHYQERNLIYDPVDDAEVTKLFGEMNMKLKALGRGHNEPVGTAKLLHIFAPHYFPLIDNSEAQALGLTDFEETLTINHYLTWMSELRKWLQKYIDVIEKLEKQHNSSILRLVDEGLYMMSTVKQKTRVADLEICSEG